MPVTDVTVVGNYALATWEDYNTGGQTLLRFDSGYWHPIGGGGGIMDTGTVEEYDVPPAIASQLVDHNVSSSHLAASLGTSTGIPSTAAK
jgi:hypothetical protein